MERTEALKQALSLLLKMIDLVEAEGWGHWQIRHGESDGPLIKDALGEMRDLETLHCLRVVEREVADPSPYIDTIFDRLPYDKDALRWRALTLLDQIS